VTNYGSLLISSNAFRNKLGVENVWLLVDVPPLGVYNQNTVVDNVTHCEECK